MAELARFLSEGEKSRGGKKVAAINAGAFGSEQILIYVFKRKKRKRKERKRRKINDGCSGAEGVQREGGAFGVN